MKSTPALILVIVLAMFVGATVVYVAARPSEVSGVASGGGGAEVAALSRRVDALEREVRELREARDSAAQTEAPSVAAARGEPAGAGRPSASPREQVEAWNAREGKAVDAVLDVLDSDEPEVRERVSGLVRQELEDAKQQEREQRQARRLEREEERTRELASSLGLDAATGETFVKTLVGEREKMMELFGKAREEGSFDEAREQVEGMRAETDMKMRKLLSDKQFEAYVASRDEEGGRWGGGGGGRGRGGRGGRGGD